MLFRNEGDHAIAIPQPSHAWLSGQLARVWGNERFARPSPYEEVCLGAEQHDIGWFPWEAAPSFNPATGRPHEFREVATAVHIEIWRRGVRFALAFGHYPALLVSLHANTIFGSFFDFGKAAPQDAEAVRAFLDEQHEFQAAIRDTLSRDPGYADAAASGATEHNRLLVAAVDWLSLAICWGVADEALVPNVPTSGGERVDVHIRSPGGDPENLTIDPWPFATDRVAVRCEGVRFRGRFPNEAALQQAFAAPLERAAITATLRRG